MVPPGGYVWWYVDGISDDGEYGLTIIAFVGSVFSPYYAWAGRRNPNDHCAINVALYGRRGNRWTMTERRAKSLSRDATHLTIGPSSVSWEDDTLVVRIDETTVPIPSPVRGTVRLRPTAVTGHRFYLDAPQRHQWWPIAPHAQVEVDLKQPGLSWTGSGYLDTNQGSEPLEDGFEKWTWSRGDTQSGAAILYDMARRDGMAHSLALRFDRAGEVSTFEAPPRVPLPTTSTWGIERDTRSDGGDGASVVETLEDTPFYARSLIKAQLMGESVTAMHESLSLDRFATNWVRLLLPFRMPRLFW